MPGKAAKIQLSEKQLELLQKIRRETTASVRLVQQPNGRAAFGDRRGSQ